MIGSRTAFRLSALCLRALFAINALSIFGYATFVLHPVLLVRWPWAATVFGYSYAFFARTQILLAAFALALELYASVRWRWLPSLLVVTGLSALSEGLGTFYGVPFGRYEYTSLLGPLFLGKIPYLIPLSWFFIACVSFRIAAAIDQDRARPRLRCLITTTLVSAWDLTLDPAMSHLSQFWVWEKPGSYFGAPLSNLVGWAVTALVISIALETLHVDRWLLQVRLRFCALFYAANLSLPIGLVICSALWQPVVLTGAVFLGLMGLSLWLRSSAQRPVPATGV